MKNLEGVQVGDEVIHFRRGTRGKVESIQVSGGGIYFIRVRWATGYYDFCTPDGRLDIDEIAPSIGFALPEVVYAPRPKRMVKKEFKVYANIYSKGGYCVYLVEKDALMYAGNNTIAIAVPLVGSYEVEE